MQVQALVNEFKGRAERVGTQTQDAYKSYRDARKQAYGVVSDNVQNLAKAQADTALSFYSTASERFNAARKESIKNVISVPVDILPEGRERLVSAYREAQDHVGRTRNELGKIVREGFEEIRNSFVEAKAETKTVASKTATQAKTSAKRAQSTAEKRASSAKTQAKKGASQAGTQAKKTATQARKGATSRAKTQARKGASQAKTQARKTVKSASGTSQKKSQ